MWVRPRGLEAEWAAMTADDPVAAALAGSAGSSSRHNAPEARATQLQTLRAAQLILGALRSSPASEAAHITACEDLLDLVSESMRRAWLRETKIVPGLLEAMARHLASPRVCTAGVTGLALLAMDMQHREVILNADGIRQVVTVLRAHSSDPELQQFGIGALLQLLSKPDQVVAANAMSIPALAATATENFPTHAEIQRLGARLRQRLDLDQRRPVRLETAGSSHESVLEPEPERISDPRAKTEQSPPDSPTAHYRVNDSPRIVPVSHHTSLGKARAQAFIDMIHGEAAEDKGPSPEAHYRWHCGKRTRLPALAYCSSFST